MLELLQTSPLLAGGYVFFIGLCVGSFLNVVIYRLPVMLERRWQCEAAEVRGEPPPEFPRFNLMMPRSRCPHCGHEITALENVPVLSWAVLRGRCSACKAPISARYPLVELATALLSLLVFMMLGPTLQMLAALPLTWALVALTLIDFDTQLLPDDITLPLLWGGLLVNVGGTFVPLQSAVIGAVAGYLSLWSVYWLYKLLTGKEGMGYGDFKLMAALGAWLGWVTLPLILLFSSVVGTVIGLGYLVVRKESAPFAFGPYIAIAGFIALLWGQPLLRWYLGI
ncbi:MAG: prepilin peptidase [Moraxellaceae bacterium]|jgi:leader peptidase (prepilin peptidase)/N-methyltransferase|nr:prepilin peptidase [Moraxellaceae bacterium]